MISFDEALEHVKLAARPLGTERLPLEKAAGRVLASTISARIDGPRVDVSTMDGYAVREADLAAFPCRLRVLGEAFPGAPYRGRIEGGSCVRIFTGGAVPAGADRVVIQEEVTRDGDEAVFGGPLPAARYVRRQASDFAVGDVLVPTGRKLDPRALVAAAGADVDAVDVYLRPRVAIVATGDELVRPGEAAAEETAIPESISLALALLVAECGGCLVDRRLVPDDLARMKAQMVDCLSRADAIVVTGGASVGERDFAKRMFDGLELLFSKVSIKPGKPVWLGRVRDRLVLGLPGNPTSALVTARLLLQPLLEGLAGRNPTDSLRWRGMELAVPMEQGGERETFWRARDDGGKVVLIPNQDSGGQRTLVEADLLVRQRPRAPALEAGSEVAVLDF